jgi:hypothetical protein
MQVKTPTKRDLICAYQRQLFQLKKRYNMYIKGTNYSSMGCRRLACVQQVWAADASPVREGAV